MSYMFDSKLALEQFEKRKAAASEAPRMSNATLPAGSPMFYYCRFCGEHTETLPELHLSAPRTTCEPCQVLRDHGLI